VIETYTPNVLLLFLRAIADQKYLLWGTLDFSYIASVLVCSSDTMVDTSLFGRFLVVADTC
jgi:hypothetical protein